MKRKKGLTRLRVLSNTLGSMLLLVAIVVLGISVAKETIETRPQRPTQVEHRVLFLCSYDPLYFTYEDQAKGLAEALYPNGIEYDAFYMDTKNYPSNDDKAEFYHFFKQRISQKEKYEAVILGDDDALKFALRYQDDLFKGLPMVFFGINDLQLAQTSATINNVSGFYEQDYLKDTLEMAMKMFPSRHHYVALHDKSAAGTADAKLFFAYGEKYRDYTFTDIDTSSMTEEELQKQLFDLDLDTVLLYMTCYTDCYGNTYSMLDRTSTVVNYTDVPVFRNYSGGRDMGVLGGTYMDFQAQAYSAAMEIVEVLNNKADINSYSLVVNTPAKTELSYNALRKFGVSFLAIPRDSVVYGRPISFWERFGKGLPVVILILVSMGCYLLSGHIALLAQKAANEEIMRSRDELRDSEMRLKYQAEHDDFLNMLNRRSTVEYLNKTITLDQDYSIMMVDIDGFKNINENYGHDLADTILKSLAARLEKLADMNRWLLGRYGGDEFLIMVPNQTLDKDSDAVKLVAREFAKPIRLEDDTIILSASVGIANSDGVTLPEQQVINAEIAMYEAKESGKNMVSIFADDMKNKIVEEVKIKATFHDAFNKDGFYMVYQPKVDAKTKEVVGYEALVRMKDTELSPAVFVPIIEKNGWITRLGRLTTELVIKQLSEWKDFGYKIHPVSINFSSKQVNDAGYVEYIRQLLKRYEVEPEYVQIEITESLLMENSHRMDAMFKALKSLGVRVLMDDFGTGYSALGYLTYMPIDEIKLDKSLVDAYLIDGKDSFIKDVIQLIHDMNKLITIEGVEEKWQYDRLCEFDADTIQGYYFSKPLLPIEAITYKVSETKG